MQDEQNDDLRLLAALLENSPKTPLIRQDRRQPLFNIADVHPFADSVLMHLILINFAQAEVLRVCM